MAQSIATQPPLRIYRASLLGTPDPLFRKCLSFASVLGVAATVIALLVPFQKVEIKSVDDVPERFAKLILEEPKAPPVPRIKVPPPPKSAPTVAPKIASTTPPPADAPPRKEAAPAPRSPARRQQSAPAIPETRGTAGRERAQAEVSRELASVKGSLDEMLEGLSTSLATSSPASEAPRVPTRSSRRSRSLSGRSATQLAGVGGAIPAIAADAGSSAITGSQITVEAISGFGVTGGVGSGNAAAESGRGGGRRGGSAVPANEYRSDASLLAVVRRYAPGIQFCYDNELKKSPGLKGKLVVAITVAPSGNVIETSLVQESVGSKELVACALAQIEAWKFEPIPEGVVTFHAPFVFTPPE